ncbi:MAG: histidinol-phosphatase [Acidobacteria bacterium]|nr:histidinol-phosphatase [Acidobacteriota bacterium]
MHRAGSLLPLLLFLLISAGCHTASAPAPEARWWKGNLHTHSLWSDGDDFPEMIIAWYADRGYDFVALSDHNILAEGEKWVTVPPEGTLRHAFDHYLETYGDVWVETKLEDGVLSVRLKTLAEYRPLFERPGELLIIKSEEITDGVAGKPVHVNATNIREMIPPQGGATVLEVMQNNVDAVLAQRERLGVPMFPHINHPNYVWAVTAEDLVALKGERFFEVYNGHPLVHNDGDEDRPSTDELWDIVLTARVLRGDPVMFGLATDDAHHYHAFGPSHPNPGRGWVMVRAEELTVESLIAAMEAGDFYATTGVTLDDVVVSGAELRIEIAAEPGVSYVTRFIGTRQGGETGTVLSEAPGVSPSYRFRGGELYVRAKIISSKPVAHPVVPDERETAWTQPVTR